MCPSFHLLHNISHLPKLLCNESLLKTTPKSSNREQLSSSTHLLHGEPVPAECPILLIGNNTRQLCGHAGQDEVPPKAQHGTWVKFCGKHLIKASIFNNLGKDVCCFLLTQSSFAPPYPRDAGHLLSTDLAQSQRLYEPREMFFSEPGKHKRRSQALPPRSSRRTKASPGVSTKLQWPEQTLGAGWHPRTPTHSPPSAGDLLRHQQSVKADPKMHNLLLLLASSAPAICS